MNFARIRNKITLITLFSVTMLNESYTCHFYIRYYCKMKQNKMLRNPNLVQNCSKFNLKKKKCIRWQFKFN